MMAPCIFQFFYWKAQFVTNVFKAKKVITWKRKSRNRMSDKVTLNVFKNVLRTMERQFILKEHIYATSKMIFPNCVLYVKPRAN